MPANDEYLSIVSSAIRRQRAANEFYDALLPARAADRAPPSSNAARPPAAAEEADQRLGGVRRRARARGMPAANIVTFCRSAGSGPSYLDALRVQQLGHLLKSRCRLAAHQQIRRSVCRDRAWPSRSPRSRCRAGRAPSPCARQLEPPLAGSSIGDSLRGEQRSLECLRRGNVGLRHAFAAPPRPLRCSRSRRVASGQQACLSLIRLSMPAPRDSRAVGGFTVGDTRLVIASVGPIAMRDLVTARARTPAASSTSRSFAAFAAIEPDLQPPRAIAKAGQRGEARRQRTHRKSTFHRCLPHLDCRKLEPRKRNPQFISRIQQHGEATMSGSGSRGELYWRQEPHRCSRRRSFARRRNSRAGR